MKTRNVRRRQWRKWMRGWDRLVAFPVTDLVIPPGHLRRKGHSETEIRRWRVANRWP